MAKKTSKKEIDPQTETLRDGFAMLALTAIIQRHDQLKFGYSGCENILVDDCLFAYRIADAMLDAKQESLKLRELRKKN